LAAQV
jgi:hypothetical protein